MPAFWIGAIVVDVKTVQRRFGLLPVGSSAGIVLLALSFVVILDASFTPGIGRYDEGFTLTNAVRLLAGAAPNRDYWALYPPGTAGVLAIAFHLFGPTLLVARCVSALWLIGLAVGLFVLFDRMLPRAIAGFLALVAGALLAVASYPSYSATPAIALCVLAMTLLDQAVDRQSARFGVAAGGVSGLIVLFRHDFAVYFGVAAVVALLILWRNGGLPSAAHRRVALVWFATTAVTGAVLVGGLLLWGGPAAVIEQLIVFPLTGLRATRHLKVPSVLAVLDGRERGLWALFWLPLIIVAAGRIGLTLSRAGLGARHALILPLSGALSVLLVAQSWNRLDLQHAIPSLLFASLFAIGLLGRAMARVPMLAAALHAGMVALGVLTVSGVVSGNIPADLIGCAVPLDRARCMPADPDQARIVAFIGSETARTDFVFVGNTRHDIVYVNDAALYFLLRRPIPVRWNEMHPGVVTTEPVQRAMVAALDAHAVDTLVLVDIPPSPEPNASAVSSGVRVLDAYIAGHFAPVFASGAYTIWRRTHP